MTILRSGSTKQYSDNWASAFGRKGKNATSTKAKKSPKKKVARKSKAKKR